MKKNISFAMRLLMLLICAVLSVASVQPAQTVVQAKDRELRGVWVSTVANIDYPTAPTTDAKVLKQELITMLDHCKEMGFKAVFFQVRPCSDALYKSSIFPWSKYLTGEQGKAPSDDFDPLAFAVDEAHKRGMELHAWLNPYRISTTASEVLPSSHIAAKEPWRTFKYDNKIFFDPGIPENREYII